MSIETKYLTDVIEALEERDLAIALLTEVYDTGRLPAGRTRSRHLTIPSDVFNKITAFLDGREAQDQLS